MVCILSEAVDVGKQSVHKSDPMIRSQYYERYVWICTCSCLWYVVLANVKAKFGFAFARPYFACNIKSRFILLALLWIVCIIFPWQPHHLWIHLDLSSGKEICEKIHMNQVGFVSSRRFTLCTSTLQYEWILSKDLFHLKGSYS